jgi:ribonuclease HII
LGCHFDF